MLQMIFRCRNIVFLVIFFQDKRVSTSRFKNFDACHENVYQRYLFALRKYGDQGINFHSDNDMFMRMQANYEYRDDCFDSNKFLHLTDMLVERGFVFTHPLHEVPSVMDKDLDDKLIAKMADIVNVDAEFDEVNDKYLHVPLEHVDPYKAELKRNPMFLNQHFVFCKLFFRDPAKLYSKLKKEKGEFMSKKNDSVEFKIILLNEILFQMQRRHICDNRLVYDMTNEEANDLQKMYTTHIRSRTKEPPDFKDIRNATLQIGKLIRALGICSIIKSKLRHNNEPRYYEFSLNEDVFRFHEELYQFRNLNHVSKLTVYQSKRQEDLQLCRNVFSLWKEKIQYSFFTCYAYNKLQYTCPECNGNILNVNDGPNTCKCPGVEQIRQQHQDNHDRDEEYMLREMYNKRKQRT